MLGNGRRWSQEVKFGRGLRQMEPANQPVKDGGEFGRRILQDAAVLGMDQAPAHAVKPLGRDPHLARELGGGYAATAGSEGKPEQRDVIEQILGRGEIRAAGYLLDAPQ